MNVTALKIFLPGLLLTIASALHGQGTIVYHNPPDIPIFAQQVPYDLDLDQNGTTDFRLLKTGGTFTAHGIGDNASLTTPEQPPSVGVYVVPLSAGDLIGPTPTPPNIWFETYSLEPIPGLIFEIPAYFHGCTTMWCSGAFHEVTAYWGVQFEIEGNLHYGWVQVATLGGIRTGGTILDWAYNSIPNMPILAGQVPEPGTWALLSVGAGLLGWRIWRRRQPV